MVEKRLTEFEGKLHIQNLYWNEIGVGIIKIAFEILLPLDTQTMITGQKSEDKIIWKIKNTICHIVSL